MDKLLAGHSSRDPNYDGVNLYGDETTQNLSSIASSVFAAAGITPALLGASNTFLAANPTANLAAFNTFLTGAVGAPTFAALQAQGINNIIFGASPSRNFFNNQSVSRTGYNEKDVINPLTVNFKLTGGLYYKITENIESSFQAYFGTGNTVYTGSDRYSLKDLKIGQYKLEVKHKDWYVRAYTTHENAGNSFNATITTRLFNERWKSSNVWYPTYMAALVAARDAGLTNEPAFIAARKAADQGRPTGFVGNNAFFKDVASTPISKGGGLFLDKSRLNVLGGSIESFRSTWIKREWGRLFDRR